MPIVTQAEFMQLPESLRRTELIEGEVVVSPSPTRFHQRLVSDVSGELKRWAIRAAGSYSVEISPLDVKFGANILQPDVMVFSPGLTDDVEMPIRQVPLVCVEVVSSSRAKDFATNRLIYAIAGVQEYWVVDPEYKQVSRFGTDTRAAGIVAAGTVFAGTFDSVVLGGFSLDLSQLFSGKG